MYSIICVGTLIVEGKVGQNRRRTIFSPLFASFSFKFTSFRLQFKHDLVLNLMKVVFMPKRPEIFQRALFSTVREGKTYGGKRRLVMVFLCKGGGRGNIGPIHNFEAHFCASNIMEFLMKIENFWYFWALFLNGLY